MCSPFREPVPLPYCCWILYAAPPTLPALGFPSESARISQTERGEEDLTIVRALAHEPTILGDSISRQALCYR
jgi:hypothetical protein